MPREGATYYDLRVTTSGTKPDDEDPVSAFEEVKTYNVINGRYALRRPRR